MSVNLYDISVPLFLAGFENLKQILQKGEKWADEKGVPHSTLLEARLAEDMLPLKAQPAIASNMVKFELSRVGGAAHVAMDDNEASFADLYTRIDRTLALLHVAKPAEFAASDTEVRWKAGPMQCAASAADYVRQWVIPNFYFHITTVYAILRNQGVPLGKVDFLGDGVKAFIQAAAAADAAPAS